MFRSFVLFAAMAIPASLAAAPTVSAELAAVHSEAIALCSSADNLMMLARNPMKYSPEAHSTELARAQRLADRISGGLHRMNAERDQATPAQIDELDAMDVHLRAVVRDIDAAIRAFNSRNGTASLYSNAYQSRVEHLYEGAQALAAPAPVAAATAD